tara:strand:- start:218 stop:1087 length:870 start_codon:yes stop_codon:yes gene_type:complete
MLKRINTTAIFFYFKSIIIFLSIFILKVNAETKIIAKNGDTLLKLSKKYGIQLKELMHKNNFNDANKILEGEIIIIPSKDDKEDNEKDYNNPITYKVIEGDTLYKIARDYNISIKDIISINYLDNASFLKPNQIILLPEGSIKKKEVDKEKFKIAKVKVFYHQTSKIEELSEIAMIHKVPLKEIININNLTNQTKVNPNTKLKIRTNKVLKWLKYGSLTIQWSDWRYLDGNYITQAKNKKNKSFYLAINCQKRALNNTLNNSYWTSWYFPKNDFEFKIINDLCDQDINI